MSWDQYGRWINDGRYGSYDPRLDPRNPQYDARYAQSVTMGQGVPPGWSSYGQGYQPGAQQEAPQPGGMSVTPAMVHADIERVNGEQDVIDAIVPGDGVPRMYMTDDERLFATKRMGPNGPKIVFYRPEEYHPEPKLDPREVVLRSELAPLVTRCVDDRLAQLASAPQPVQETPAPVYSAPETPVSRAGAKKKEA